MTQDPITLIEQIRQKQAEIAADLEKLKDKENEQYTDDITAIQEHQSEIATEVEDLQNKIKQDKTGGSR